MEWGWDLWRLLLVATSKSVGAGTCSPMLADQTRRGDRIRGKSVLSLTPLGPSAPISHHHHPPLPHFAPIPTSPNQGHHHHQHQEPLWYKTQGLPVLASVPAPASTWPPHSGTFTMVLATQHVISVYECEAYYIVSVYLNI